MTTILCDLPASVEPGALPKRVRFYALRREILTSPPMRAFVIGLAAGIGCTLVCVLVMALWFSLTS